MSNQAGTHHVQQFAAGIMHLAQQRGSIFTGQDPVTGMSSVTMDTGIKGDRAFYDQLGLTAAAQITTRGADTVLTDTPHARRMLTLKRWGVADLVDELDKVRSLNDPTSDYARSFAWAVGRAIDDEVISALLGSASTGVAGGDSTPLPAAQQVAGSAGLTAAKLAEARRRMMANNEMEDGNENRWYCVVTAEQHEDLLNDTNVQSLDFNTRPVMVDGQVQRFMGFTFLHSERLTEDATPDRQVIAWNRSAIKLGFGENIKGNVEERADKNYNTQVFFRADFGAVRMRETGVVEIACGE